MSIITLGPTTLDMQKPEFTHAGRSEELLRTAHRLRDTECSRWWATGSPLRGGDILTRQELRLIKHLIELITDGTDAESNLRSGAED